MASLGSLLTSNRTGNARTRPRQIGPHSKARPRDAARPMESRPKRDAARTDAAASGLCISTPEPGRKTPGFFHAVSARAGRHGCSGSRRSGRPRTRPRPCRSLACGSGAKRARPRARVTLMSPDDSCRSFRLPCFTPLVRFAAGCQGQNTAQETEGTLHEHRVPSQGRDLLPSCSVESCAPSFRAWIRHAMQNQVQTRSLVSRRACSSISKQLRCRNLTWHLSVGQVGSTSSPRDFHLETDAHAGRTSKGPDADAPGPEVEGWPGGHGSPR